MSSEPSVPEELAPDFEELLRGMLAKLNLRRLSLEETMR